MAGGVDGVLRALLHPLYLYALDILPLLLLQIEVQRLIPQRRDKLHEYRRVQPRVLTRCDEREVERARPVVLYEHTAHAAGRHAQHHAAEIAQPPAETAQHILCRGGVKAPAAEIAAHYVRHGRSAQRAAVIHHPAEKALALCAILRGALRPFALRRLLCRRLGALALRRRFVRH